MVNFSPKETRFISNSKHILMIFFIIFGYLLLPSCSHKKNKNVEVSEITKSFSSPCEEFHYLVDLSLNVHLTKRQGDHRKIYTNAVQNYLSIETDLDDSAIVSTREEIMNKCDQSCSEISLIKTHVNKADSTSIMKELLSLYINELDPHSSYLYKDELEKINSAYWYYGNDLGIGVYFDLSPEYFYGKPLENISIKQIAYNSPAYKVLNVDDILTSVNDKSVNGMKLIDLIKEFNVKNGESIKITVRRGENLLNQYSIKRDSYALLQINSGLMNFSNKNFYYLRVRSIDTGLSDLLKEHISNGNNTDGMILDLRSNLGGSLYEAIRIADLFVSRSLITITKARNDLNKYMSYYSILQEEKYYAIDEKSKLEVPLIVLMNHRSASAAELLAGFLQVSGKAFIFGEKSFGKGIVQHRFPLIGKNFLGGELRITISRYYLPDGTNPQGTGIIPDIDIPNENTELEYWINNFKQEEPDFAFREEDYGKRSILREDIPIKYTPKFNIKDLITNLNSIEIERPIITDDHDLDLAARYLYEYVQLQ